ncbi:hypothetical protein GCM10010873_37400 [Cypionkella aquatica]|uniref:Uncharacterized protein n=1 Tax=Cypionkella aquatica TaxID=1756042 RepID=A0AA37UCA5_9RHOB|nr:hypothetical protein [Cypionkella aquatica]GLS88766.1 hypothetical protein GCM10010873_37400 [Cypionkella aquatica]
MTKLLPMTAEDWKPFLNQDEALRWFGSSRLAYYWTTLAMGAAFFGVGGIAFGNAAFFYPDLQSYCFDHHTKGCSKFFAMRWPGLVASVGFVLIALASVAMMWLGWLRHNFALTDRRALWIINAPWRKTRAKLYETDYLLKRPHITMGAIKFGNSASAVRFIGLSPEQRRAILDMVSEIAGEHKQ